MKISAVFVAMAIAVASIVRAAPLSARKDHLTTTIGPRNDESTLQTRTIGTLVTNAYRRLREGPNQAEVVMPLPVPQRRESPQGLRLSIWNPNAKDWQHWLYDAKGRREDASTKKADYTWEDIHDDEVWMNKWHAKEQMKREIPRLRGEEKTKAEEKVAANEALLLSFPYGEEKRRWYPVYFLHPDHWEYQSEQSRLFALNHPHWDQLTGPQRRRAVENFEWRLHAAH